VADLNILSKFLVLAHGFRQLLDVPSPVRYNYADDLPLVGNEEGVILEEAGGFILLLGEGHRRLQRSLEFLQLGSFPSPDVLLHLFSIFAFLHILGLFFFRKILLDEQEHFIFVAGLHRLLEAEHLVANIIAHLYHLVLVLKLFAAAEFQYGLALLVGTLVFLAPVFVLGDILEEDQLLTVVALYLKNLDELLQNMGAWSHPHLPWALEGAAFLPFCDTRLAEELAAILALDRVNGDLEADSADQRVLQLLMHLAIHKIADVVPSLVVALSVLLVGQVHKTGCLSRLREAPLPLFGFTRAATVADSPSLAGWLLVAEVQRVLILIPWISIGSLARVRLDHLAASSHTSEAISLAGCLSEVR